MTTPVGANITEDYNVTTPINAGYLFREDISLKAHLQGITVPTSSPQRNADALDGDPNDVRTNDGPVQTTTSSARRVPVFFRFPENEAQANAMPFITIDYLTTVLDYERMQQGYATYGLAGDTYRPDGMPAGGGKNTLPVPTSVHYQVTTYARSMQHDRLINTVLLTRKIPQRYGAINMVGDPSGRYASDDNSMRRLDVLSGPTNGDTREGNKRLFRKIYTVAISSEMFEHEFTALSTGGRVITTVVDLSAT